MDKQGSCRLGIVGLKTGCLSASYIFVPSYGSWVFKYHRLITYYLADHKGDTQSQNRLQGYSHFLGIGWMLVVSQLAFGMRVIVLAKVVVSRFFSQ